MGSDEDMSALPVIDRGGGLQLERSRLGILGSSTRLFTRLCKTLVLNAGPIQRRNARV
jgi:hypothetical protein